MEDNNEYWVGIETDANSLYNMIKRHSDGYQWNFASYGALLYRMLDEAGLTSDDIKISTFRPMCKMISRRKELNLSVLGTMEKDNE